MKGTASSRIFIICSGSEIQCSAKVSTSPVSIPLIQLVPSIQVPDTVFYKFDQPVQWYFTFENGVKKKLKNKLTKEDVERAFLKNVPASGVVAMYFYYITEEKQKKIVFEYYDAENFSNYLGKSITYIYVRKMAKVEKTS